MTITLRIDTSFEDLRQQDGWGGARVVRDLRLGDAQRGAGLTVYPVLGDVASVGEDVGPLGSDSPIFLTLGQGLRSGQVIVTEVGSGGSVPQLHVENRGSTRVLLLAGEEVRGGMQNRLINSDVLLECFTSLVVPTSCSQQGRWRPESREFADSGVLAHEKLRHEMRRETHDSMRRGDGARSCQSGVWREIDAVHARHKTTSNTSALRDVFAARKDFIDKSLAAFPLVSGQRGVLVLRGASASLELISYADAYSDIHEKVLGSHIVDARAADCEPVDESSAHEFLRRVAELEGEAFDAIGVGADVRYRGDGVLGQALFVDECAVHASFSTSQRSDFNEVVKRDITGAPMGAETARRQQSRVAGGQVRSAADSGGSLNAPSRPVSRGSGSGGRSATSAPLFARARRFADYLRSLPGFELTAFDAVDHHMGALIIDAILQAGVRYDTVVIPRVTRVRKEHPEAKTTSAFAALLGVSDPHELLDWGGTTAITRLLALTDLLLEEGVEDEAELLAFLDSPGGKARVTAISGIKDKTFAYLRFLAGAEDAVAVDRHLRRHLERCGVQFRGFDDAVEVYREAASLLGVSPATLEWSVFSLSTSRALRQP